MLAVTQPGSVPVRPVSSGTRAHASELGARFDALYLAHYDAAVRWARHLGCATDRAEDAAQEAFVVAFRRFADYNPARGFRPWILGIVRQVVRSQRRADRRREDRERAGPRPLTDEDPEREAELARVRRFVEEFLQTLPGGQREVFALCEIEGLRTPEAADVLEEKLSTVRARRRQARDKFERAAARWRAREERRR